MSSSFKIWNENEEFPSYKFIRFGFGESIIKRLSANSYIFTSLSWYRTDLTKLRISESGVDRLEPPFDTTALTLSYVVERRDDPFNPSTGDFFSTDVKFGFPLFEKNYSFIKFKWSYQKNLKFLKQGNISFSVRNGFASGDMSITERFFAGGIHSFRGTYYDRLGPVEKVNDKIYPMGGNALVLLNFEVTFPVPIAPVSNLYYCLFADVGNVFEKVSDFDLRGLRRAVGFGVKYKTPLGPLKVTFAWNFGERKEERDFKILWGIGNVF